MCRKCLSNKQFHPSICGLLFLVEKKLNFDYPVNRFSENRSEYFIQILVSIMWRHKCYGNDTSCVFQRECCGGSVRQKKKGTGASTL